MMIGDRAATAPGGRTAARATAVTPAASLAVLTGVLGYLDGTGQFAPENWLDAGAIPTYATSPACWPPAGWPAPGSSGVWCPVRPSAGRSGPPPSRNGSPGGAAGTPRTPSPG
jgi:hypothetical protein